jgi:hypothetical protein
MNKQVNPGCNFLWLHEILANVNLNALSLVAFYLPECTWRKFCKSEQLSASSWGFASDYCQQASSVRWLGKKLPQFNRAVFSSSQFQIQMLGSGFWAPEGQKFCSARLDWPVFAEFKGEVETSFKQWHLSSNFDSHTVQCSKSRFQIEWWCSCCLSRWVHPRDVSRCRAPKRCSTSNTLYPLTGASTVADFAHLVSSSCSCFQDFGRGSWCFARRLSPSNCLQLVWEKLQPVGSHRSCMPSSTKNL